MSAIKKALRSSIRRRRYSMFEQKENDYIHTPISAKKRATESQSEKRSSSSSGSTPTRRQSAIFRRGSQMTKSVRDAMGTIRQKLSTRKLKPLQEGNTSTPVRSSSRRRSDVPIYSPFRIETPGRATGRVARRSNIRTVVSVETPTRLRREVEALTANMQALAALTPNTLQTKRKSPPLTNGSLMTRTNGNPKAPRSARRRIATASE